MRPLVLVLSLVAALSAALSASKGSAHSAEPDSAGGRSSPQSRTIRLAAVRTVFDGGLFTKLIDDFQKKTGYSVQVYVGRDPYEQAKTGRADVVFSHFRHAGVGAFVSDGFGLWPVPVAANVTAFLVPPGDPARVRNLSDPPEIFRKIAHAKSPFVINGDPNTRYLIDTLWHAAGRPDKDQWYMDLRVEGENAAKLATEKQAYSIWGVTAFLKWQETSRSPLQLVIPSDSLMQRVMVCVVVNPKKFPKTNIAGATALEQYLRAPQTQALIHAFRIPGIAQPVFLPAGRNNENSVLEPGASTR